MKLPVYLDYAATTPVDPRVAEAIMGCLTLDGNFANPASRSHLFGWQAEEAVEDARNKVAELINADPRGIVWTSGATESDNLAIKGLIEHYGPSKGRHIITSAYEHKAVLDTCEYLEQHGCRVTYLKPDSRGLISSAMVSDALASDTVLVSLMHVNNEVGTINNISEIGSLCKEKEVFFHVDAAQSAGKIELDVEAMNIDLLSISAHKFYGPKGIGVLYARRSPRVMVDAQIHGGGHERGMRSGTLPTHQIVGIGLAAELAKAEMKSESARIKELMQKFWSGVCNIPGIHLNGDHQQRVPGIINLGFEGLDGETLLMALKDLAISTGSACTSASLEPSFVLKAMGVSSALAHSSLRISMGRFTTEDEVEFAVKTIKETVSRLQSGLQKNNGSMS